MLSRIRHRLLVTLQLPLLLLLPQSLLAAEVDEGLLEVIYLHRLVQFAQWPHKHRHHQVAVVGDDRLKPWFVQVNKQMQGHALPVRFCADLKCAAGADILFFDGDNKRIRQFLAQLSDQPLLPVLTIGRSPGFIDQGGAIGFVRRNHKLRFEVNLHAIQQHHLYLRSDILPLAHRVIGSYGQ
ncbi:MAG: YfiR family protein [Mariprofundales bacterium]